MKRSFRFALFTVIAFVTVLLMTLSGCGRENGNNDVLTGFIGTAEGLTNTGVNTIAQDGEGQIWVGTQDGLFHLTGDRCVRYTADMMGLDGANVSSIVYDPHSQCLWISTLQSGISIYDFHSRTFRTLGKKDGLASDMIAALSEADDGGIWIFHHKDGIQHWKDGELTDLHTDSIPDVVRGGIDDGKGNLLLGHRSMGISKIDIATGRITEGIIADVYTSAPKNENLYILRIDSAGKLHAGDRTSVMFIDRDNNRWSAKAGRGIVIKYTKAPFFRVSEEKENDMTRKAVEAIAVSDGGGVWMTADSLLLLTDDEGYIKRKVDIGRRLGLRPVMFGSLFLASGDTLYIGLSNNDIAEYSIETDEIRHVRLAGYGMDVCDFAEDSDGRIWAATEQGIFVKRRGADFAPAESMNASLRSRNLHAVAIDPSGNLWVGGSGNGVTVFDRDGKVKAEINAAHGMRSENVSDIYSDTVMKEMLVGTDRGLLIVADYNKPESFEIVDQLQGAADDRIESVTKDSFGVIWISTPVGVSSFDRRNHRFINYSHIDGIPEGKYAEGSVAASRDGRIYFGSYSGAAKVTAGENAESGRVPVETVAFRNPVPWWRSAYAIAGYVFAAVAVVSFLLFKKTVRLRDNAVRAERVLQRVAPIKTDIDECDNAFLEKVSGYVERNCGNADFSIYKVAEEMAMSYSTFNRRIKQMTGNSAGDFVRKIRLRLALHYIENERMPLSQVAEKTGFHNPGNFRQAFKKEFGKSPSEVNPR